MGGLTLRATGEQPALGASAVVMLMLIGWQRPLKLNSTVRWHKSNGFGVQFNDLTERQVYLLMDIIATLDRARAKGGRKKKPPSAAG